MNFLNFAELLLFVYLLRVVIVVLLGAITVLLRETVWQIKSFQVVLACKAGSFVENGARLTDKDLVSFLSKLVTTPLYFDRAPFLKEEPGKVVQFVERC